MKKQTRPQLSMFEQPEETKPFASETEAQTIETDPDACPKCGKKALVSVRPMEYGGLTHYCPQCPGTEPGEPFRFVPRVVFVTQTGPAYVETPAEQSKRIPGANDGEIQVYPALTELPREVETEVVGEGEQQALIETGHAWEREWKQMPEFVQPDAKPWGSVLVNFESRQDMDKFAKLVRQKIGLNTRSIWYPEAEISSILTKRYSGGK